MAYNLVMFFRPILRNQLFRIFEFRLFFGIVGHFGQLWVSVTVEKVHNGQQFRKKVEIQKSKKVDFLGLIQRT